MLQSKSTVATAVMISAYLDSVLTVVLLQTYQTRTIDIAIILPLKYYEKFISRVAKQQSAFRLIAIQDFATFFFFYDPCDM